MNLDYKLEERMQVPLIRLGGSFDAEAAAFVKDQFTNLVNEQQPYLVVDMSRVTFLDSLGLAALVSGLKLCRKNRGVFKLAGLQPNVRMVFEVTRLDQAFELYNSVDDAFAGFSGK